MKTRELLPQGAEIVEGGVRYRVWAPAKKNVEVEVVRARSGLRQRMTLRGDFAGYHHVIDAHGVAGDRYGFLLDGGGPFPDPASRWQPDGVHGLSMVIDPRAFHWSNDHLRIPLSPDAGLHEFAVAGVPVVVDADADDIGDAAHRCPRFRDIVLYELHIGTFTETGTFRAAIEKLDCLHDTGVNAILIMPVADFPGGRNWGYDGVALYAPARCYGHPDDLRALVDAAHARGIAVVLDVVFNHFGPDGNYLAQFSPFYFTKKHATPWGDAVNFDGEHCEPVREFFIANAEYWLDEFHVDGLRLDATHSIVDDSPRHILEEIAKTVGARGGHVIAEDERNLSRIVEHSAEGWNFSAVYADDFCHSVQVALGDARFVDDFDGSPRELADTLRHGWHYRGQISKRHGGPRGTECAHIAPERFLFCISNHDQAGNRAFGERLHELVPPEAFRAAGALLLLSPFTPMIFMGQEWAASAPFLYFTDHEENLGRLVTAGRRREFARDPQFADPLVAEKIPDPQDLATFEKSKLNWSERDHGTHAATLALYRECLRLRASDAAFRPESGDKWQVENIGVVALRSNGADCDWLLLADLAGGHDIAMSREDFCRLPDGKKWERGNPLTNEARFGGSGGGNYDADSGAIVFTKPEALLLQSS